MLRSSYPRRGESSTLSCDKRNSVPDKVVQHACSVPDFSVIDEDGKIIGNVTQQKDMMNGVNLEFQIKGIYLMEGNPIQVSKVFLWKIKKRRTDCEGEESMGYNTEIGHESKNENMDQDVLISGPKNGFGAGSESRACLGL